MSITIIAAVAKNRAIGKENQLLYWLPNDLKRFKSLTSGHTIIMGRHTFDSLPKGALPNRRNIVLSRTVAHLPGCECYPSFEEAMKHCEPDEKIFIIGGAQIYQQTIDKADRLCLTEINDIPKDADAFFPSYEKDWKIVEKNEFATDDKHKYEYAFVDYVKSPKASRY
ncbi:MAG: dihydrofolate reductase [Prevotellaceae bacterium]|nr:dihydrofolate reductase [Prevotellaceae bacterium]MDY6129922.1 dihydrofolate reductase [Prevotella sp.]